MPEGEESSQSEDADDVGRKGRKKKGENVRENSLVKKNVNMIQKEKKLLEPRHSNLYTKGNIWYKVSESRMYFQLPLYTFTR